MIVAGFVLVATALLGQAKSAPAFNWQAIRVEIEKASTSEDAMQKALRRYNENLKRSQDAKDYYALSEARYQCTLISEEGYAPVSVMPARKIGVKLAARLEAKNVMAQDYVTYAHWVKTFREPGLPLPPLRSKSQIKVKVNGVEQLMPLERRAPDVPLQNRIAELYRKAESLNPKDPAVLLYKAEAKGLSAVKQVDLILAAWDSGGNLTHRWLCRRALERVPMNTVPYDQRVKAEQILKSK